VVGRTCDFVRSRSSARRAGSFCGAGSATRQLGLWTTWARQPRPNEREGLGDAVRLAVDVARVARVGATAYRRAA